MERCSQLEKDLFLSDEKNSALNILIASIETEIASLNYKLTEMMTALDQVNSQLFIENDEKKKVTPLHVDSHGSS
jgi:septal ring factor EnvC (AmiA/AmiB activator)